VGRISPQCLGLYSDENELALTKLVSDVRRFSDIPIGIQFDHAGRKASTRPTWELWRGHGVSREEGGGEVVPSGLQVERVIAAAAAYAICSGIFAIPAPPPSRQVPHKCSATCLPA